MREFIPFSSEINANWIDLNLIDAMLLGLVVYTICFLLFFRKLRPWRNILLCLLFIYAGALVSLTISPIILNSVHAISSKRIMFQMHAVNFRPFASSLLILHNGLEYDNMKAVIYNLGGNFIMLMPLALLLPLIFKRIDFFRMLIIAFFIPIFIESMQLLGNICGFSYSDVNIDDVILNFFGCIFMYIVFMLIRTPFRRKPQVHNDNNNNNVTK